VKDNIAISATALAVSRSSGAGRQSIELGINKKPLADSYERFPTISLMAENVINRWSKLNVIITVLNRLG
jgi:hypothetical protein